jgi:hypothetical protein
MSPRLSIFLFVCDTLALKTGHDLSPNRKRPVPKGTSRFLIAKERAQIASDLACLLDMVSQTIHSAQCPVNSGS